MTSASDGPPPPTAPAAPPPGGAPRALARRAAGVLTRHKRLVRALVLALVALFLVAAVRTSWARLGQYHWHLQWGYLVAAFLLFTAQELTFALIWRAILARLGSRLGILSSERIYLGAEFVRYIPGNVWHVITRVLWAERRGVPKAVGFASMVLELATKLAAAALVFALTLLAWPDAHALAARVPRGALLAAGILGVPLLLVGLHPRLLARALNTGLRALKREPLRISVRYADVLRITAYWALSWIVGGAGFALLVRSLVSTPLPAVAPILAIGIFALGWDIGFLSFVTPSGLGIREAAIAALLVASGLVPVAALALVVALLARLLTTGAELAAIAGAYLIRGEPLRPQPMEPQPAPEGATPRLRIAPSVRKPISHTRSPRGPRHHQRPRGR